MKLQFFCHKLRKHEWDKNLKKLKLFLKIGILKAVNKSARVQEYGL